MLLYFVQNVFFKSKIILLCVIIAIHHTSCSETSASKTQLTKKDRGRKQPLRKNRCRKFPVKLVLKASMPLILPRARRSIKQTRLHVNVLFHSKFFNSCKISD